MDADPPEPFSDEDVVCLANRLLGEFNIPTKLERIEDISAALFVILYESLFSERLPGIIRQPYSKEDEIHNCQIVIDVLSTEIVRDSLSHIRGADIVEGNITAISNLLDIFSYLLEYVENKIESDVPTDTEDKDYELGSIVTEGTLRKNDKNVRNKANGALSQSKNRQEQKDLASNGKRTMTSLNRNENRSTVITHEDFYNMTHGGFSMDDLSSNYDAPPSPIRPDQSESLLGQKTLDSTDLDAEVERLKKRFAAASTNPRSSPKIAWTEKIDIKDSPRDYNQKERQEDRGQSVLESQTSNGDAPVLLKSQHVNDGEKAFGLADKNLSASVPLSRCSETLEKPEPFRSTVGPIECHFKDTSEKTLAEKESSGRTQEPNMVKGLSSSYNDLRELVEKTAALTRVALRSSPIRMRTEKDLNITDFDERPQPVICSDGARRAKELNAERMKSSKKKEYPAEKVNKKVVFVSSGEQKEEERSEEKDQYFMHDLENQKGDGGLSRLASFGYPFTSGDSRSRFQSNEEKKKRPSHYSQASKPRDSQAIRKTQESSRALALHLARNRQPELGAAHMNLQTEDRAVRKKQDFLRRMYSDNLEEFTDDVDVLINMDNEAAKDIETEMLKCYEKRAAKAKGLKKSKSTPAVSSSKKLKMSKSTTSQARNPMTNHRCPSSSPALSLKSDEDLLSILLEEFPHLYLSDHTWHELWRKGLHQIESLTRVYQENKRKKSRAQSQMEDAAERHNLLTGIMNKQLEHSKRMRDIKERKTQQVQIRNRAHEKRMQSARARRYYNEYQIRARGKQLKRRTKEEMVFREVFKDALSIQKERLNEIRQYTSDQRQRQESQRQNEIDSLENFYHDQFALLSEKLAQERKENSIRNAAQNQMLDRMKRELRKKMEQEVKLYQEQIFHDDDDVHFRQIDADKLKHQLHKACYTSL